MNHTTALVPIVTGRPPIIRTPGGVTVYLSLRDLWHVGERKRLRHLMRAAHPDKGGTVAAFTHATDVFRKWVTGEQAVYAALGLGIRMPVCAAQVHDPAPTPAAPRYVLHPATPTVCADCGQIFNAYARRVGVMTFCKRCSRGQQARLRRARAAALAAVPATPAGPGTATVACPSLAVEARGTIAWRACVADAFVAVTAYARRWTGRGGVALVCSTASGVARQRLGAIQGACYVVTREDALATVLLLAGARC